MEKLWQGSLVYQFHRNRLANPYDGRQSLQMEKKEENEEGDR